MKSLNLNPLNIKNLNLHRVNIGLLIAITLFGIIFWADGHTKSGAKKDFEQRYSSLITKTNCHKNCKVLCRHIDRTAFKSNLNQVFDLRKEDYKTNIVSVNHSMQSMVIFLIIGILILFYRPESIEIPFLSLKIPQILVYIFVSIGLVYLWIQFGLAMNSSIDSRYALQKLISFQETNNGFKIASKISAAHALVDNGIVDNWCSYYLPHTFGLEEGEIYKVVSTSVFFGIFGVFFGIIHAICLILIIELSNKTNKNTLSFCLYAFSVVMLIISSGAFVFKFNYAAFFITFVWAVALFCSLLWRFKGIKISERIHETKSKKVEV